jgi:hypothetical protein
MMGHREKIKGGDEQDCFTQWRHVMCYMHRPRVKHNIKKKFSRRVRKEARRATDDHTEYSIGWQHR